MEKELDPKKYHVLDKQGKNLLLIALAVILFIFIPIVSYYYVSFAVNRPSQTGDEHTIEIESGWSISKIAQELYSNDVINSKALFTVYVLANNLEKNIQAGVYTVPAGISIKELSQLLQHGTDDVSITFLEGWRVEQFALKAAEVFDEVDYEDFVRSSIDDEGYLFPDTYIFPADIETEEMISVLKETFDTKVDPVLTNEALESVGLTRDAVITFASIVEREVADSQDRPLVAGVLIKRYNEGQQIGADATVQYYASLLRAGCNIDMSSVCPEEEVAREMDWWPYSLTQEELNYDTEYNTRKNIGLPPQPISSVSVSAIKSVLNNKQTSYNYYLTDKQGITHFSENLETHEANINRYLR